jgi:hypothetical protein
MSLGESLSEESPLESDSLSGDRRGETRTPAATLVLR